MADAKAGSTGSSSDNHKQKPKKPRTRKKCGPYLQYLSSPDIPVPISSKRYFKLKVRESAEIEAAAEATSTSLSTSNSNIFFGNNESIQNQIIDNNENTESINIDTSIGSMNEPVQEEILSPSACFHPHPLSHQSNHGLSPSSSAAAPHDDETVEVFEIGASIESKGSPVELSQVETNSPAIDDDDQEIDFEEDPALLPNLDEEEDALSEHENDDERIDDFNDENDNSGDETSETYINNFLKSDENNEKTTDSFLPKILEAAGCQDDAPIYKGSSLTLGVSIMLIMTFVMRHHISGTALADLLSLIEIHMITPNLFKASITYIRKCFMKVRGVVVLHYHCKDCLVYIGKDNIPCPVCKPPSENNGYFLVIPLLESLQSLFLYEAFLEKLRYPVNRKKSSPNSIEDIIDGKVYKKHFAADGFLHKTTAEQKQKEIHISLQMNTDGVSLFKSSKMQIWPIYYTINELHPKFRYQRKYRIFAGLWFDVKKPDFKTFLNPFMQELNTFGTEGKTLKTEKGDKKVRVFLLSGIFDAPAKSQFQNISQFNGEYGCSYCLEPGKTVKAGKGHTHCFPFNHNNVNGHTKMRTHESMIEHATKAQNQMMESGQESKVCGVKGMCWPMMLPRFDIVNGLGLDYMHNTLLGVVKMLMKLWFLKNYKKCPWYVGNQIKQIDQELKSLKLPNLISRVPRSIEKDFGQWKASEFRSFFLMYSIPLAKSFLPAEYFDHYVLLVQAVAILLKEVISQGDLEESTYLLKKFCLQIERLYGERYYTYNVHNLLHLTNAVENLGPLWCQSAFWYEDYNSDFKYLFHGTQSVSMQIVTNTIIQHKIPEIARSLLPGCTGFTLYSKMTLNYHQLAKNSGDKISHNVFTVGKFSTTSLPSKDKALVDHCLHSFQEIKVFKRICLNGNIIQSKEYTRVTKRNSYTVNYNGRYGNCYGFVKYFIRAQHGNAFGYYAILELLNICSRIKNTTHILSVSKDITLDICKIDDVIGLCTYISCKSGNYIAIFPNKIEND